MRDRMLAIVGLGMASCSSFGPAGGAAPTDAGAATVDSDRADSDITPDDTDLPPSSPDADGDGVPASEDCDDGDPAVFPGADERCNDRDDDCDRTVDEDPVDAPRWYADIDGDGMGEPGASGTVGCDAPSAEHVTMPHPRFVPFGAVWAYLDNGQAPPDGWTAPGFDDSAWARGPGPHGYGNSTIATTVSYGGATNNKHPVTWLRTTFVVPDASRFGALTLRLRRDDGALVFLNGVEVVRDNLPTGAIGPTTLAVAVVNSDAEDEIHVHRVGIFGSLRTGENVLAVQVHQQRRDSSDLILALEAEADLRP